jgi:hypothetical protein
MLVGTHKNLMKLSGAALWPADARGAYSVVQDSDLKLKIESAA